MRKTNNPLVSIIIVNWNGLKYLKNCFESLINSNYKNHEIVFVDNGSTDGSIEFVMNNYPYTIIIENKENMGFAEANNQGVNASSGEYILFLNNDTIVTENFLIELANILEDNINIGACQSKTLLMDNPHILDATGSFMTPTGFLSHDGICEVDTGQYNQTREIFSAKGVCMLVRRSVLNEVGVFDKDFFAYFEETDLCWRIWLAGYKIFFVPDSVIYHKMGGTTAQMYLPFIEFHSFKNRICSLLKNLSGVNLIKIMPIHIFFCCGVCLLYALMRKSHNSVAIMRAILWNLMNFRSTSDKRTIVQRQIRKVSDKQIFSTNTKKVGFKYYFELAISYCAIK